ncbi:MAG TPA: FkbM family methyltransferase [Gammaproteobacteria bacterium]
MIVDTRALFVRLLRTLEIATVCDVGSMDGTDALRFRRVLPRAAILALEPNPRNVALMRADGRLARRSIRVLPFAASDRDAEAPLFVVDADYAPGRDRFRRGMSSLHRRADGARIVDVVTVRTVRLDALLRAESLMSGPIALWIDTEGMAFEAIAGAAGILGSTAMLHVEAETQRCIGPEQRLLDDVERLLGEAGFRLLATDQPRRALQLNALFLRADSLAAHEAEIRRLAARARARRGVKRAIGGLLPRRLRHLVPGLIETRVR